MIDIPVLSVQGINKSFDTLQVLNDISFNLCENEIIAVIGHSGCGKTTLLRIAGGFESCDDGLILLDGARHTKPTRDAVMLFQSFDQLQPWRTVLGNVTFPLATVSRLSRKEIQKIALKRIDDVGLTDFMNAYPCTLSGGMKQRVAVARALALAPRVLLMDEPFASLDNITRKQLQTLTLRVCAKYGISVLLVTHSVEEAVIMADKIIVMSRNPGAIKAVLDNSKSSDISETDRDLITEKIIKLLGEENEASF